MLGGDFNFILDPKMDTSNQQTNTSRLSNKTIYHLLNLSQLVDVWRLLHPIDRDYSFYSPVHDCYSRTDFFLLRHRDLSLLHSAQIGSITWSDHAPISVWLSLLDDPPPKSGTWPLNESLLQDQEVRTDVLRELQFYFSTNANPDTDPMLSWEAHNPYKTRS